MSSEAELKDLEPRLKHRWIHLKFNELFLFSCEWTAVSILFWNGPEKVYSTLYKCTLVYPGVPKCILVYLGVPWCTQMYLGVPKRILMYLGVSWCNQVYPGVTKCILL